MTDSLDSQRQASADIGNIFSCKYADWVPSDLVVPDGLTREKIKDAARLVFAWQESGEPYAIPLVLEIFECLRADEIAPQKKR